MTRDLAKLDQLIPMLDMVYRAQQAKLAQVLHRIDALQRQLSDLERPPSEPAADPVTMAEVNMLWETWVLERKKVILQELALAARDREAQRPKVAQALARFQAATKIRNVRAKDDLRTRARRSSW